MTEFRDSLPPPIQSVFHPSDLSPKSALAFVHALKIALVRRTRFEILHVNDRETPWYEFPSVRGTLERWGVLEPGTPRSAVLAEVGIDVSKVASKRRRSAGSIAAYLRERPMDLLVLATEGRQGRARFLRPSFAERLARRVRTAALFVPEGVRGFVSPTDGAIRLARVLVAVDHDPPPQPAVDLVGRLFHTLDVEPERLVVAHLGAEPPAVRLPMADTWPWEHRALQGEVVTGIQDAAEDLQADLIIMTTRGPTGIREKVRGSTTERVVRGAPCPVVTVPIAGHFD